MPRLLDLAVRHAVVIRAPIGDVFAAFATGAGLDGWFTRGAKVDPREGGRIRLRWEAWGPDAFTGEEEGDVLVYDPPRRFAFTWSPDRQGAPSRVELTFEARGEEETVVRVVNDGFEDTPSGRFALMDCAAGWGEALTLAKAWVERGLRIEEAIRSESMARAGARNA